jgi:ABC-2 type transport system ATP-binding protein
MIQLENLVKDYGDLRAVDHINFQVEEGEILGFLGPNGAGKSTTLKMLTSYLSPTKGNINVDNFNIYDNSREIRKLIGYLPEHNPLYTEMTVYDYLKFIADAREIPASDFKNVLKKVVQKCGLNSVISRPISNLSKGFRQRVGLAQAIIHDPKIIILDEPTNGLDPNQIIEIRELIKELGREKTLIISSHILQEVQAVCDRIIIINKGKIVADGSTEELKSSFQGKTKLTLDIIGEENSIPEMATSVEGIKINSIDFTPEKTYKIVIEYDSANDRRSDIYNFIKKQDWVLLEMHREYVSLEDVFRNLTVEEGGE